MKKLNKKGSHVSLILSFILFVIALVFIYLIISSSITKPNSKLNLLNEVKGNVLNEISDDVWVFRAFDESNSCIELNIPGTANSIPRAFDKDGNEVGTSVSGNTLLVDGGKGFVKIYYSNYFTETENALSSCTSSTLSSAVKEKRILEGKFLEVRGKYESGYTSLKEELDIPINIEFDLSLEDSEGTTTGGDSRELKVDTYSDETKIYYLDVDGKEKTGILRIKIW